MSNNVWVEKNILCISIGIDIYSYGDYNYFDYVVFLVMLVCWYVVVLIEKFKLY